MDIVEMTVGEDLGRVDETVWFGGGGSGCCCHGCYDVVCSAFVRAKKMKKIYFFDHRSFTDRSLSSPLHSSTIRLQGSSKSPTSRTQTNANNNSTHHRAMLPY